MVIGGGLAGLSAACALADHGFTVTLIERRAYLGGRAFSFHDPATGRELDNGQHVYLRCCTAYTGFLRQIGAFDRTVLQRRLRVAVANRTGKTGTLTSTPLLPAPLDLLPSLLTFPHLGVKDRLRVMRGMFSVRTTNREANREALESMTFRAWLMAHGQSPAAITALWELITLPILNDRTDAVSAYMGIMALQDSLLAGKGMADLGYSRVGLSTLVGEGSRAYIESRGGRLLTGRRASRITIREGRAAGIEVGDEAIPADAVICATPWDALPPLRADSKNTGTEENTPDCDAPNLEWAPIVGLHVGYDRPVMSEPFLAVVDSPVQWIFNRSVMNGSTDAATQLLISISAAWQEADMSADQLREMADAELRAILPAAADAAMTWFRAVKQPQATFRCLPGAQARRPSQRTAIPGLFLAGDWTQTGWPATMESAVRSGVMAAAEVDAFLPRTGV